MSRRHRSAMGREDLAPLDWQDPAEVRRWLHGLRCCVHDVVAIARDNRHARRFRILPPAVSRARFADSTRGLRCLLRAAQIGLPEAPKGVDP